MTSDPKPTTEGRTEFEDAIAAVLDSTEPGDVVTYGEVAAEAGYAGAHRAVGSYLRKSSGHPWWRVVNASGRLVPGNEARQARKLKSEGVEVRDGRVRFAR
ncbi:MAG: MGMT family protein [Acidimicrobiales bacterium]